MRLVLVETRTEEYNGSVYEWEEISMRWMSAGVLLCRKEIALRIGKTQERLALQALPFRCRSTALRCTSYASFNVFLRHGLLAPLDATPASTK